jgi:hypothetical protein
VVSTTQFMGRPKKQHKTKHVRMREEMADQIKLIAVRRNVDMADLMYGLFSNIVQSEYVKTIEDLTKQSKRMIDEKKK